MLLRLDKKKRMDWAKTTKRISTKLGGETVWIPPRAQTTWLRFWDCVWGVAFLPCCSYQRRVSRLTPNIDSSTHHSIFSSCYRLFAVSGVNVLQTGVEKWNILLYFSSKEIFSCNRFILGKLSILHVSPFFKNIPCVETQKVGRKFILNFAKQPKWQLKGNLISICGLVLTSSAARRRLLSASNSCTKLHRDGEAARGRRSVARSLGRPAKALVFPLLSELPRKTEWLPRFCFMPWRDSESSPVSFSFPFTGHFAPNETITYRLNVNAWN